MSGTEVKKFTGTKSFWYLFNSGAIIGWMFVLIGFFSPYNYLILKGLWILLVIVFGIIHPLEIMISLPLSHKKGFTTLKTMIATVFLGLGWWVPVHKGIFKP